MTRLLEEKKVKNMILEVSPCFWPNFNVLLFSTFVFSSSYLLLLLLLFLLLLVFTPPVLFSLVSPPRSLPKRMPRRKSRSCGTMV